ncbi:MAG TPA: hypothetical protein VFT65_10925 [Candidatus Angelobacter sp.]|nr:hypothetical protein [Candidatus Angelobacter sp.]
MGLLLLLGYAAFLNARRRRAPKVELGELIPAFLPVDVEVLADLVSPAQQRHLQETYGQDELLRIYREQLRLTIECLRRMTHNAALLQQLGYCQLRSGNQLIASLAQEMIDAGVHVRLYTFVGLIVLHFRNALSWIPMVAASRSAEVQQLLSTSLIPAYAQLKDKAGNLTCLKFSSFHDALSQSL